jgi:hypothetical protein
MLFNHCGAALDRELGMSEKLVARGFQTKQVVLFM